MRVRVNMGCDTPRFVRGSDNSTGIVTTPVSVEDVIPPDLRGSDNCRRKRLPYILIFPPPLGADSALADLFRIPSAPPNLDGRKIRLPERILDRPAI